MCLPCASLLCRYMQSSVVVSAPKNPKRRGRELQLPSMSLLTSKMSDQKFFLRMLKVVIQLRDAAKKNAEKEAEASKAEQQDEAAQQAAAASSRSTAESQSSTLRDEETMDVDPLAPAPLTGDSLLSVKTGAPAAGTSIAKADDILPRLSDHLSLGKII